MSSVWVVVIVGVIIAVLTAAAISGEPKPATPRPRPERGAPPLDPIDWGTPPLAAAEDMAPAPPVLEERGFLRRLRSAAVLGLTIVVLGVAAAAILGSTVLLGARALNRALG